MKPEPRERFDPIAILRGLALQRQNDDTKEPVTFDRYS